MLLPKTLITGHLDRLKNSQLSLYNDKLTFPPVLLIPVSPAEPAWVAKVPNVILLGCSVATYKVRASWCAGPCCSRRDFFHYQHLPQLLCPFHLQTSPSFPLFLPLSFPCFSKSFYDYIFPFFPHLNFYSVHFFLYPPKNHSPTCTTDHQESSWWWQDHLAAL